MENKFAENDYVSANINGDILSIEYKPNVEIHSMIAAQIMTFLENFCQDKNYLVLEDMNNIKWIDKRSRDYFAQHPFNGKMKGWAYFSSQPIHKIMYTIYYTFSKPQGNTAFFTNKEDGLNWLLSFR